MTKWETCQLLSLQALSDSYQAPPSYGFGRYGFGFFGPRIAFRATGALWGRATPFLYHFIVHLSSVLGRTELCHEVWTPGPQNPKSSAMKTTTCALFEVIGGISEIFHDLLGTSPPLTGGLSGPEMPKKSRKCLPGPPAWDLQKVSGTVWEVSGESPESVWRVFPDFLATFSVSQAGGPRRHFRDFFGISGPEGSRDPCKGAGWFPNDMFSWFHVCCPIICPLQAFAVYVGEIYLYIPSDTKLLLPTIYFEITIF